MTTAEATRSVTVVAQPGSLVVVDHACGTCPPCVSGQRYWCATPTDQGTTLLAVPNNGSVDDALGWLSVLAAVQAARISDNATLLVLSPADPAHAASLFATIHRGPIFAAADSRDETVRAALSESTATGRADAIATLTDGRAAVKAVMRGGDVCLPDRAVAMPTVTELVQREVRLVGARDLSACVRAAGRVRLEQGLALVL